MFINYSSLAFFIMASFCIAWPLIPFINEAVLECSFYIPVYWSFSHDVTAAIFVYKTMNRQPCLCTERILWELNSFHRLKLYFIPSNLQTCWLRDCMKTIYIYIFTFYISTESFFDWFHRFVNTVKLEWLFGCIMALVLTITPIKFLCLLLGKS